VEFPVTFLRFGFSFSSWISFLVGSQGVNSVIFPKHHKKYRLQSEAWTISHFKLMQKFKFQHQFEGDGM